MRRLTIKAANSDSVRRKHICHWAMHLERGRFGLQGHLKISDAKPKWGSDRDYRKETQSDEFGRSCSDPDLGLGALIF